MPNPEHVKIVRQGAAAIAEWRDQNPDVRLDLGGANLSGGQLFEADLSGADLGGADLTSADLRRANLFEARLTAANLSRANLIGAFLFWADLPLANLTKADLTGAELIWANLSGADFSGASLTGALLGATSLGNCDLSQAAALAAVTHMGPSSIAVDTIIASFRGAGNKLTPDLETFFLGAGVPRELLAELPRIVAEVKYYSCFICYGQPDLDFATRLCDDLERRGVSCWLYDLDATPGERTWREIGRKRRESDRMVIICSVRALLRDGVLKEIEEQIDDDPDKMVPVSRDSIWTDPGFRVVRAGRDLTPWLRDRNYADFSDESCYEDSLQRLLKALRRKAE
jgi:hypothetical protein